MHATLFAGQRRNVRPQVPSAEEAWEHYRSLLRRLLVVCSISSVSSWRQLQSFLRDFADMQPGQSRCAHTHAGSEMSSSSGWQEVTLWCCMAVTRRRSFKAV